MRKSILLLALASVSIVTIDAASAQDRARTGVSAVGRHPQAAAPKTPEEVMSRLSTHERAQELRKADLATRKAFGAYQAAVAEARREGDPTDADAAAVLAVTPQSATREQIARFGADSDERWQQVKNAGRATQRAFDKFQDVLWREQALTEAAGTEAQVAAFGQAISRPDNAVAQDGQNAGDQND